MSPINYSPAVEARIQQWRLSGGEEALLRRQDPQLEIDIPLEEPRKGEDSAGLHTLVEPQRLQLNQLQDGTVEALYRLSPNEQQAMGFPPYLTGDVPWQEFVLGLWSMLQNPGTSQRLYRALQSEKIKATAQRYSHPNR